MPHRQRYASNSDHRTLQDHEGDLLIGKLAIEASL